MTFVPHPLTKDRVGGGKKEAEVVWRVKKDHGFPGLAPARMGPDEEKHYKKIVDSKKKKHSRNCTHAFVFDIKLGLCCGLGRREAFPLLARWWAWGQRLGGGRGRGTARGG